MAPTASVVETIWSASDKYSDAEQAVAEVIVKNLDDVPTLSVRQIAEMSGTSVGSVSRFVQKAGFDSIAQMRVLAAGERASALASASLAKGISCENVAGSVSYILETTVEELRATAALLDPDSVGRVVELIHGADMVLFAAVGNSIPVCSNLAFKLRQIGIRAVCPSTTESMMLASMGLTSRDLVFMVSNSGRSKRLSIVADNAADANVPMVMVTSNPSTDLAKASDVVLQAVNRDERLGGDQFSTHLVSDFIIEALFFFVLASSEGASAKARMERKIMAVDKDAMPTLC